MLTGLRQRWTTLASGLLLLSLLNPAAVNAERRSIDVAQSVMKVYVDKSGLFSVFAHDHEILAPITEGTIEDSGNPSVEFLVETARMQVLDPKVSEKDRAEIQQTMRGPQVLDVQRYAEIRFQSTAVERTGEGRWVVRGNVLLHGETRPVTVQVSEERTSGERARYRGSASLKQTDFGIKPVSLFGGTVKVKDVVRIEFEIAVTPN
jgi:hypothetical protein